VADYRLAVAAEAQLGDILAESEQQFGDPTRRRHAALVVAAMQDVADNLRRPAIVWHPIAGQRVGVYHTIHSRDRVGRSPGPADEPQHYLVLRVAPDGVVEVLGVVPERMLRRRALQRVLRANQVRP
jgi:hypothetical protein